MVQVCKMQGVSGNGKGDCLMLANDTTMVADCEDWLQVLLREFGYAQKRRKLKASVINSKVMRTSVNLKKRK